jgi:hypothetical protein
MSRAAKSQKIGDSGNRIMPVASNQDEGERQKDNHFELEQTEREKNDENIQIVKEQMVELEKSEKDIPAYHKSKTSVMPKNQENEFFSPRSNNTIKA